MKKINFRRHILPHLVAIVTFLLLTVAFFHPIFLENKAIQQHDVLQWWGSAQEAIKYKETTGEPALWTNSMFSGMPTYLIQMHWSGDLLAYVYDATSLWLPVPAKYLFIALLGFYILLLAFKVRPYLALIGAIAFALNTFNIISIEAGHNLKVGAIAYMPLVVAGIHIAFNRNLWWGFVLATLGTALHLRMNHLQITYYLLFVLLFYGISQLYFAYRTKQLPHFLKVTSLLIVAAILTIGANFGKMWTVYEYGKYSTRGPSDLQSESVSEQSSGLERDYVFNWSSGKLESMTLLIPYFYGGASQQALSIDSNLADALKRQGMSTMQVKEAISRVPTYWGSQPFTSGPMYAGAIICFLFILGAIIVSPRHRYWIIAATILSLVLSWGKNFEFFNYFMYDYFPGYSKFRSVSMAITIAMLCMPLLGFLGLEKLLQLGFTKESQKATLWSLGITGGICLLVILFAGAANFVGSVDVQLANYPNWFLNALREDRESMMRSDAFRSLFFIVAFIVIIWFLMKQKLSITVGLLLLGFLLTLDFWLVDRRFLNKDNYQRTAVRKALPKTEADQYILQDTAAHYRVLNLINPWNDAKTSYYHKSIGGYHGAKMGRYQELINHCLTEETNKLIRNLQQGAIGMEQYPVINMLNAKYLMAGNTRNAVIKNEAAAGNAWFAEEVVSVSSANEEIEAVCDINSPETAVIDVSEFDIGKEDLSSNGTIKLIEYEPNYLKYISNNASQGLALFSEVYYPEGWEVMLDGEETSYIRANYVLRAMVIPPGKHTIEFRFTPKSYFIGNKVMMISSGIIILIFLGSLVLFFKNELQEDNS